MSKKVFIKTFGCQMNEYDSGKMADVLQAAQGYEPTNDVEEADLNRVVNFVGQPALTNTLVEVKITETRTYSLRGELL